MYSQKEEELHILNYFADRPGRLVSIGENDGKTFSNALALIEKGWEAVLIEPSPGAFRALQQLHKDNERVCCLQLAVGTQNGLMPFYDGADSLLSTLKKEQMDFWDTKFTEIQVDVLTWASINEVHASVIDLLCIDAEGMDWQILRQVHLGDVQMLCIEFGENEAEIRRYCEVFDMKEVYRSDINLIMAK
jgi:FkbM family methyltransferase